MSFAETLFAGFMGAIIGGFGNFFAQRYFFNKVGRGLDRFEDRILNLIKGIKKNENNKN